MPELREALAGWLLRMRGLRAAPEQIMITTGATQGLGLVGRLLHQPQSVVLVEDPVHTGLVKVIERAGFSVFGIPVDERGLRTEQLQRLPPQEAQPCAFVYVTPSHQYPTGSILPADRRQELVRFVRQRGCMLLTLPVLGIKLNTVNNTVVWRFDRILALGAGIFVLAVIWDWCFSRKASGQPLVHLPQGFSLAGLLEAFRNSAGLRWGGVALLAVVMLGM